jgi:hypothetical protein
LFSLDHVHDDETLYHVVVDDPRNFKVVNGELKLSSTAFGDRERRPSVDRAYLRDNDPRNSQWDPSDCIVSLITHEVRSVVDVRPRAVDVIPDPIENHPTLCDNLAHALIITKPAFDNDSQFKKLKKALTRIYTVLIPPGSLR